MSTLLDEANVLKDDLIAIRRQLHQNPELGLKLPMTVELVKKELDAIGVSYEVMEDISCVVATIGSGKPVFLIRGDMDALPVLEQAPVDFPSKIEGLMHACGHDMHCTAMIGAARMLKAHEAELKGTVKLFFQSAEEIFAGAAAAIERGLFEDPKPEAAFAMHVGGAQKYGTMLYGEYCMSAVYGFRFILTGKGAHGSTPEMGIDPINTGAHIYLALQELIAREVAAADEAVLTLGKFESGKAANIIPHTAVLEGTLRTFRPEVTEYLVNRIQEVAKGVAATYRTQIEIETLYKVPATICNEDMNQQVIASVNKVDPEMEMVNAFHAMGSEDFAFICEKIPTAYCFVGAGVEDESQWRAQHNPEIMFREDVLPRMAAIYTQVTMDWLNNHSL